MAKLKQERNDLSALLSAATGGQMNQINNDTINNSKDIIDNIESEPLFTFNKEDELKKIRKKCRNTIKEIARAVLPADILKITAMQDKIESDAMSMVGLQWQIRLNEIMQDAITDSISKGNMSPRMIEVFTQLTDKISQLSKQALTTEVQMRKNYLDFKTDMIEKRQEEQIKQKHIEAGTSTAAGFLSKGTKSIIDNCKQNVIKQKIKDAKSVDFQEIKK